jgi:hypothetical protein
MVPQQSAGIQLVDIYKYDFSNHVKVTVYIKVEANRLRISYYGGDKDGHYYRLHLQCDALPAD